MRYIAVFCHFLTEEHRCRIRQAAAELGFTADFYERSSQVPQELLERYEVIYGAIAPKRVRTVHGVAGRAPKFVLLEGVKLGGEGLHWLEPLVLRNEDGSFTGEWHRIYDAK